MEVKCLAVVSKWNEAGCFKERHYIKAGSFEEAICKFKDWFVAGWNLEEVIRL